jgi:endo-1,4-beta-D-glucanase Y
LDAGGPLDHPFGRHTFTYAPGVIRPGVTQAALDSSTAIFYDTWKSVYVRQGCGGYYTLSGEKGADEGDELSDGHGVGMMITAIMSGHDPYAREVFDGMYAFFRKFHSARSLDLMGWTADVAGGCKVPSGGDESATGADIDIAFALVLADRQWGSSGAINYMAEATKVLAAIKKGEIDPTTHLPRLGDWVDTGTAVEKVSTRPADFIPDHLHVFANVTEDASWNQTADEIYDAIGAIQTSYSPATGLLPEVILTGAAPKPASATTDAPHEGDYDYGSARSPWRIGTAYVTTGDQRAKDVLAKMNAWARTKTGNDPTKIVNGYKLNGTAYGDGGSSAFEAPFGVAAMIDAANQAWLDAIWNNLVARPNEAFYEDTTKLICMIVMSGNWWGP